MNRLAPILVVSAAMTASAIQQSWPPPFQKTPRKDAPVLSPEASMKTITLPPGYRLELVASEPMIQEPVAIDWDIAGRMWVIEMPGYMEDMAATTEREPTGRVSVLEDTNGDGTMDKKTVFLDKLVLPRTIKVLESGVLVAEPPNLWFARDTNGDLKADTTERVTDTYGQELANVEHNANSLLWAMDNWMHTSEVDVFLRYKNGKFEVRKTLSRGQWGATQDDAGRVYRNTNSAALFVDIVPTPYYERNRNLPRTRGSYESLGDEELNVTWPAHPTPGVNRGYQDGVLREDGSLASFTSVGAPTVYRGDRLPKDLYGNVFLAEPAGNLVSRVIIDDDGTMLRGRKAYERGEFIVSTDERFRPVNLSSAPDGTLYVVDMYHGIIQHKGYITEYLRDQILSRNLEKPQGHGRIYRVVHETTKRDRSTTLTKATTAQLVQTLSHPNGWWRDAAQRMLVERKDESAAPRLKELAAKATDWRTRLHALWTLDGLDAIEQADVTRALEDQSRDVRTAAVRIAERWLAEPGAPIHAALQRRLDDPDWFVRRQLAATFGTMPSSDLKVATIANVIERYGNDPITLDAALSGVAGDEARLLGRILAQAMESPQRTQAITILAATILRSKDDAAIQEVLRWSAEQDRPTWQQNALLAGTEAGLSLAPLPGARRGAASARPAPPSGSPGARDGPGGAPAFPTSNAGGGRGRANTVAATPLLREPSAFVALAGSDSAAGKRAEAILGRLTWPGKRAAAGAAPEAAPLTPDEQKRFEEGKGVYTSLCMACHQEDGQGREKVAPTLVGSPFLNGNPGVPARILLNGKEGSVGLMPPLGAVLSDQQIAAVLTFTRRSWANQAPAVDATAIAAVRKSTSGRTRPWTEAELAKLGAEIK